VGELEPPLGRVRPSGGRLLFRRIAAVLVLLALIGGGAWLAALGLRTVDDDPPPPPPTTLAVPPPKPLKIIFPEGFTRVQMAERITAVNAIARRRRKVRPRLSERAYLRLTAKHAFAGRFKGDGKPATLEGFLFPALYEFTAKTTTRQLVQKQLAAFERSWAKVDLRYARSKNLTRYDVLIIASMIEREVQVARERPLVAAVIYNRLKNRMPLGIDATLRYGLKIPPTRAIRQSELDNPTPYNTRLHTGLPPTPIGNPGLASLQAAAKPAKVDFLFFVRNADCRTHFFTASESEFFARVNAPRC
jgi:uncharacterized YceG family protein